MKKCIYKVTNKINGKVYIGQTNNPKRRRTEHFACRNQKREKKLLYYAIEKYGAENFSFEIIEDFCEDYNEKEKYWIQKYRSFVGYEDCNGYNVTQGGEEPPIYFGEDNVACTHSEKIIDEVIYYLTDTNLSSAEIGHLTGYDDTSITKINTGKLRRKNNLEYPLRKEMTRLWLTERADKIIFDLLHTELSQKEIAEKYGVGRTTVTAINRGQNHKRDYIDYPIRKEPTSNRRGRAVIMLNAKSLEEIKYFDSAREAATFLGKQRGDIITTAIKEDRTCWGYKWKYAEE